MDVKSDKSAHVTMTLWDRVTSIPFAKCCGGTHSGYKDNSTLVGNSLCVLGGGLRFAKTHAVRMSSSVVNPEQGKKFQASV